MRRIVAFCLLFLVVSMLFSCTRMVYLPVQPHRSETVVLRDTIIEMRTAGETLNNTTTDTVSILHAERAYSVASVAQGTLSHSLSVLPHSDSIKVQWREVHTIDSIPYIVPVAGERVEVVPAWVWWMVVVFVLLVLLVLYLLLRVRL